MKRILMSVGALLALILITGCPGSVEKLAAPEITGVVADSVSVTITWQVDTTIENNTAFSGYNIYATTDSLSLMALEGDSLNKDNTTIITANTYTVNNLSQDSVYYIQVRTVNTDDKVGEYNSTKPLIKASPRPEFTATINFEWNTPGVDLNCAIRLSDATIMADSAMAHAGADLFVDCFPLTKDTVAFDSPSHSTEWGSGCRITKLINLGQYDLDSVYEVTTQPTDTTYVPVNVGDLIVVKTASNNYAKIHVDAIDTTNNQVTITYAYQNNPDFPFFSRPK